MCRLSTLLALATIAFIGVFGPSAPSRSDAVAAGAEEKSPDPDVRFLQGAGIAADDAALMDYLRKYAAACADAKRLDAWIAQLGADKPQERDAATKHLKGLGLPVLPILRKAAGNPDAEIGNRARQCIEAIRTGESWEHPVAAVRLLARRQPAGAAEVLLAVLPFIGDEQVEEDAWFALDALAADDAKVLPVLLAALKDPFVQRRAAAGCILGRRGDAAQRAAVHPLLKDAETMVRLRVAQGLLAGEDAAAVPVLIALLTEAPTYEAWQAEELLHWVAGNDAPQPTVGSGKAAARKACRAAWDKWWQAQAGKIDWAKLRQDYRRPRLMLLAEHVANVDPNGNNPSGHVYRIWLCGCDGKPRWSLDDLVGGEVAGAVQLLAGDRVLLRSGIRDLEGRVDWRPAITSELKRVMPTGLVFQYEGDPRNVLTTCDIVEAAPDGTTAFRHTEKTARATPLFRSSVSWQRGTNGRIICFQRVHKDEKAYVEVIELNARTGQEMRRVRLDGLQPVSSRPAFGEHYRALDNGQYMAYHWRPVDEPRGIDGARLSSTWWFNNSGKLLQRRHWSDASKPPERLHNGNFVRIHPAWVTEVDLFGRVLWDAVSAGNKLDENSGGFVRAENRLGLVRLGFDRPMPKDFDLRSHVPRYIPWLKSEDGFLKNAAVESLGKLGAKAEPALPALMQLLPCRNDNLMDALARAVEKIGPGVFPHAAKHVKDPDDRIRSRAVRLVGLSGADPKLALPLLKEALEDKAPQVREAAVNALGRIGKKATKEVLVLLTDAVKDRSPEVRDRALWYLHDIGANPKEVIPFYVSALKDEDNEVRASAAGGLQKMGQDAKDAIPALLDRLTEEKVEYVQGWVCGALALVGPKDEKVVAALIERAKDKKHPHRGRALWALRLLGPGAKDAVIALQEISSDPNEPKEIRSSADQVLHLLQLRKQ